METNNAQQNIQDIEKIQKIENELKSMGMSINNNQTKKVKFDRGLIERTESSKLILIEDNRQLLTD